MFPKNQTQMYNFYNDYKNFKTGIHEHDFAVKKDANDMLLEIKL